MQTFELLATALGLAALAGINLYLTVLVSGLVVRFQWIQFDAEFAPALEVLAHPAVLVVAGVLAIAEIIADKMPWFDSLWDALHTIIRPIGALFLGLAVFGEAHPVAAVIAGLLCGGVAFGTHSVKSGFRLLVNASPEPVSNAVVSVVEDAGVVGGVLLVLALPFLALLLVLAFAVLFIWKAPDLFRFVMAFAGFIAAKLRFDGEDISVPADQLPASVGRAAAAVFATECAEGEGIEWAVPVVWVRAGRISRHSKGYLIRTCGGPGGERFAALGKKQLCWLGAEPFQVQRTPRALFDELRLRDESGGSSFHARFSRQHRAYAERVASLLSAQSANSTV